MCQTRLTNTCHVAGLCFSFFAPSILYNHRPKAHFKNYFASSWVQFAQIQRFFSLDRVLSNCLLKKPNELRELCFNQKKKKCNELGGNQKETASSEASSR